ncbi:MULTISPECIES: recombinase family protein [Bacteria]|uniref:Recombinase family protein n=1 Tax=Kitasatospora cinereorecta TaxID=285560 RepID=A0ABW0VRS7_9ACTN
MSTAKFIAYYRVSTQKQGADGLGIEAQKTAVTRFLNGGDWEIIAEFTEVESGKKANRPELTKAIDLAKKTGAKLVIAKLDRLSRNLHFITGLQEAGIEFVAADMPFATNFNIHILASVAQYEREMISARTKAALSAIKDTIERDGQYTTKEGKVITSLKSGRVTQEAIEKSVATRKAKADEKNRKVAGYIKSLRANGLTLQATADALNKDGLRTSRDCLWTPAAVQRIEKAS